jgi:hypothetical protein
MTDEEEITTVLNPKPGGTCQRCEKRPATKWWSEGTIAFVHGMKAAWCERCCVEEQLKFARERAAVVPALEKQLADIDAAELPVLIRSCNKHNDCDKADADYRARGSGAFSASHCHDDCCEDCFGS